MKSAAVFTVTNARVITEDAVINDSWISIRDGIIRRIGVGKPPAAGKTLSARGNYVSAGCIDLHIHGDSTRISQEAVAGGTTGFLRSLCAADTAALCAIIKHERDHDHNAALWNGARRLGYHVEGPFLNPAMAGAQPKKALRRPSVSYVEELLRHCGSDIRIMTLAPELFGSDTVIRRLRKRGIVVSLGHSQATYEQAVAAIDAGASLVTHVYNRMEPVSSRLPGLVTAALLDSRMYTELICDGQHVHPALIQLLLRVKPLDKVVLVTDSVRADSELSKRLSAGVYRLADGTIAGSCLTMLEAIRNVIRFTGISMLQAVAMATLNPARVLGLEDRKGKLKAGYDADLVVFDKHFKCRMAMVGGKIVYRKSEDR